MKFARDLAESWETPDALTYVLRLKKGILADDVPYVPLWFKDVTNVHRRENGEIALSPAGGYEFLAGH